MRIENAGGWLNNSDSLVVSLNLVDVTGLAGDHGDQVKTELDWVQVVDKGVWKSGLLAGRNQYIVSGGSEVADHSCAGRGINRQWLECREKSANEGDGDWIGFAVGEVKNSFGRVAIDELDTENLRVGERGRDREGKVGSCWSSFSFFLNL